MNAPLPAVLLDGLRLVIVGTGGSVIVNTREFDVSPPVGDVDTVIGTVPAKAISEAGIAALNRVAETNVVLRFDPFQRTTLPETNPLPFTVTPDQYGRFLCETFDLWWPDRRKVRIRFFDNLAEALAGQKPGNCTMHETCDSYVVVEYNGDIYPCDFFVEQDWKLGNLQLDSWPEIARRQARYAFAAKKTLPRPECAVCEYQSICHGGCPKLRHARHRRFEDLDYFCDSYKMVFAKSVGPLQAEVKKLLARQAPPLG